MLYDLQYGYGLIGGPNLAPPVMAGAVVHGTPGATTYEYVATFKTACGESLQSASLSVTTGPATLSGTNYITLSIQSIPAAATHVRYFKKVSTVFRLLGEVTVAVADLDDVGQTPTATNPPTTDTSGRPQHRAMLWKYSEDNRGYVSRHELMAQQYIHQGAAQGMWDTIYKDGDILQGGNPVAVEGEDDQWSISGTIIYLEGQPVAVPDGLVTLTGLGNETIGLLITPVSLDYNDDQYLRNLDEHTHGLVQSLEFCDRGAADRLVYDFTWGIDQAGQLDIAEFVDGVPKVKILPPERTQLMRTIARERFERDGHYVVSNFPVHAGVHPTDSTKLKLYVDRGLGYPNGWRIETIATQTIDLPKARTVDFVNNSAVSAFNIPGGYVVTTNSETFDLDGLNLKLKVGSGNSHTVAFTEDDMTAAEVVTAIETEVNAYPTDGELVICTALDGYLQIQAIDGKNLIVESVADDGYTILGISTGTYTPEGTRIYPVMDNFIKTVSDLSYMIEVVESVTHNGNTHVDNLTHPAINIIGASDAAVDAHDGKWDYQDAVDFENVDGDISFAGMGGDEPTHGATYRVKYQYVHTATKGARILVKVTDAQVVKGAEDGQDNLVFTGATVTKMINNDVVTGQSGAVKDVYAILQVNNSSGQSQTQYTQCRLLKNSTALAHATSQIDWSQAGAQGSTPLGQPTTGATYYVTFLAWLHTTEGDYVSADSFDMYEHIEVFGDDTFLRDTIDFRTTGTMPMPDDSPRFDYECYLGRIDKLVIADDGTWSLLSGTPARIPPIPKDQMSVMSTHLIIVLPYTYGVGDVSIRSLEARRLTVAGVNALADRISRLEYWGVVNNWQKEVANHPVATDAEGLFTDSLTGFNRIDPQFDKMGISHTAAIDREERCLLLPPTKEQQVIALDDVNSSGFRRSGNTILLDYDPEVFDQQLFASISVNAMQDFVYDAYYGLMELTPQTDVFLEEQQLPALNVDFDNNLASALRNMAPELFDQVNWGNWQMTSGWRTGTINDATSVASNIQEILDLMGPSWGLDRPMTLAELQERLGSRMALVQDSVRQGVRTAIVPETATVDLGNRVVDLSVQPMVRTKNPDSSDFVIQVRVHGLAENQDHAITVGGKAVDFTYDNSVSHPRGAIGTHTYLGKTTVKTDNAGWLTGKFIMPEGVPSGQVPIRVFHYNLPSQSFSPGVFFSRGFMETKQQTSVGMETIATLEEIVTDAQTMMMIIDPIAQTFVVKEDITYLSGVGLYFRTKSATYPLTIQVREVINGFPGPKVLDTQTFEPDDIDVSDDATAETVFTFNHIHGLMPGNEFCFVIMPGKGNLDYSLWTAELGGIDVTTGAVIGPPMADGVMFHSPNNRTWEPWTKRDLKYKLYKANFENNCQLVFDELTGLQASRFVTAVEEFVGPGASIKWSYSINSGTTWIPFHPDRDVVLNEIFTKIKLRVDVTSLGGVFQIVENVAGILLLLHQEEADYIGLDAMFTDELNYPNHVSVLMDCDTDGTGGTGVRSVTPYVSVDDGVTWMAIQVAEGYTPVVADEDVSDVARSEHAYYRYRFETPDQATITGATNVTPIVITSAGHGFQENAIVDIASVGGNTNANGTRRLKNVTTDTAELYNPATDTAIAGNAAYTSGGTMEMSPFSQARPRIKLETTNQALTPRVGKIGFVFTRVD